MELRTWTPIDLRALIFSIRSSFWFIPILMGIVAVFAAIGIIEADFHIQDRGFRIPAIITMPIESARMALSTIAGSMITVATLVFSLVLVALTMVSQQLGPRVLLHFMDDRQTQTMLGLFIATFIFALMVLMRVGDIAVGNEVPGIAVATSALLAILSLGMMIQFIHHIATRIQADVIIHELGMDLNEASRRFVERGHTEGEIPETEEIDQIEELFERKGARAIRLAKSGYLRRIDEAAVCRIARKHDICIQMLRRPGQFALAETPVALVAGAGDEDPDDDMMDAVRAFFFTGARRTPEASIEFEINALVEVALRALSPGVNDPYTAISCLYRLSDGLRILLRREADRRVSRCEGGEIRILHVEEPFTRYLSISIDSLRENADGQTIVLNEILRMLVDLDKLPANDNCSQAIRSRIREMRELLEKSDGRPVKVANAAEDNQ